MSNIYGHLIFCFSGYFNIKLCQHIKKIGSAKSRCWYRQSVAITPPQRDNQVCRVKLYINQLYIWRKSSIKYICHQNKKKTLKVKRKGATKNIESSDLLSACPMN